MPKRLPSVRKDATLLLHRAATYYLVDKNYAVYDEVGLKSANTRARLRADVVGFSTKGEIVIVEVKSCWLDYSKDTKWESYLPFCNKIYFIITAELYASDKGEYIKKELRAKGAGLLVLSDDGTVKVVSNTTKRKVAGKHRRWLITKLAWRGGFSKASTKASMRFSTCATAMPETSLIDFLGYSKADRKVYLSKYPRCGYKKYLNYPALNTEPFS